LLSVSLTPVSLFQISIFHTTAAEAPGLDENQRARKEILAAFVWTATLFTGSDVSKPTSATGKLIRAIGLGAQKAVLLSVFSGVTALLSTGMLQTQIESFADLAGSTVCVNADSTAFRWLRANNVGFGLNPSVGVTNMFQDFWLENCEATVYDRPLLQYNLMERAAECAAINSGDRRRLHDEDAELRDEVRSVRISIPGQACKARLCTAPTWKTSPHPSRCRSTACPPPPPPHPPTPTPPPQKKKKKN